jgi:hypothetical protein
VFRQYSATALMIALWAWPHLAPAQPAVNFASDIQPILAEHCWKCHGEKRAAGGLRLDQRKFAERGGGSGKNLLVLNRDTNELLRRVRSTVESERMPSEGLPLSPAQIDLLERWIAQGAEWPLAPAEEAALGVNQEPWLDLWLNRLAYTTTSHYLPAYFLLMTLLVTMIFVERAKRARQERTFSQTNWARAVQKRLARLSRAWYLAVFLGIVIFVAVQFCREQQRDLQQARRALLGRQGVANSATTPLKSDEPIRPMHPPRLGGEYYRGNDERSPELFNGGFYRTAKFEVYLADAEGGRLAWGDPLPDQPHLRFVIERSPHSSPSLFGPEIMEHSGLSAVQPEQLATATQIPYFNLQTDVPGERWSVLFPLEPIPAQGKLSGKVYLYKGSASDELYRHAEASYLIGYELSAAAGCIARESQLWMAAVYNVPQVLAPGPEQIPADHWFDFRPIPEIEK